MITVEDIVNIETKNNDPRHRWLELKSAAQTLVERRKELLEKAESINSFFQKQDTVLDLVNGV